MEVNIGEKKQLLPLISVIMPCYNAEEYVEEAVESILRQTYTRIELICIDDCSKDNTYELLTKLAIKDSRIVLHKNEVNLKLIATLNKGLTLANGDFIARMDADDSCYPDRLHQQMEFLLKNPLVDLVSMKPKRYTFDGKILSYNPFFACTLNKSIQFMGLFDCPIVHPSILGRKYIFQKYQYKSDGYILHNEDFELWARMQRGGVNIGVLNNDSYFLFRHNGKSITQSNKKDQGVNHIKCMHESILLLLGVEVHDDYLKILSANEEEFKVSSLKETLAVFSKVKDLFLRRFQFMSSEEKMEIESWYIQRILYILTRFMKNGDAHVRLYIMKWLFKNFRSYINTKTFNNLMLRLKWVLWESSKVIPPK